MPPSESFFRDVFCSEDDFHLSNELFCHGPVPRLPTETAPPWFFFLCFFFPIQLPPLRLNLSSFQLCQIGSSIVMFRV